ncbi:hypothetical protein V5799_007691, partial [Amblyomma americanum]
FDRIGALWSGSQQRASCQNAGSPVVQCPGTHTPLHGAYPGRVNPKTQGTRPKPWSCDMCPGSGWRASA